MRVGLSETVSTAYKLHSRADWKGDSVEP